MNSFPRWRASCFASSVLPTPVGPVKRKHPAGLSGWPRPARARLIDVATCRTASLCPNTTRLSASSSPLSRSRSEAVACFSGMRAIRATTCSMSSISTVLGGSGAGALGPGVASVLFPATPFALRGPEGFASPSILAVPGLAGSASGPAGVAGAGSPPVAAVVVSGSCCSRSIAPASSRMSMALSGRRESRKCRAASLAAASSVSSGYLTLWWTS